MVLLSVARAYAPTFSHVRGVAALAEGPGFYWYNDAEVGYETSSGTGSANYQRPVLDAALGFQAFNGGLVMVSRSTRVKTITLPTGETVEMSGVDAVFIMTGFSNEQVVWLPIELGHRFAFLPSTAQFSLDLVSVTSTNLGSVLLVSHLFAGSPAAQVLDIRHSLLAVEGLIAVSTSATSPKVFTVSNDDVMHIRDLALTTEQKRPFPEDKLGTFPAGFALSADGERWAFSDTTRVWVDSLSSSAGPMKVFTGDEYDVSSLSYVNGQTLAVIERGVVRLLSDSGSAIVLPIEVSGEARFARRIVALESGFAVVTQTGLQLFDSTTKRVGGADPIAPECTVGFKGALVNAIGPNTIGVGGKRGVFSFSLSAK